MFDEISFDAVRSYPMLLCVFFSFRIQYEVDLIVKYFGTDRGKNANFFILLCSLCVLIVSFN